MCAATMVHGKAIGQRKAKRVTSETRSSPLLTIPEAARHLRLSRAQTYRLAQRGDIPAIRIGRSVRIRREALDRWLDEQSR